MPTAPLTIIIEVRGQVVLLAPRLANQIAFPTIIPGTPFIHHPPKCYIK